MLLASCYGYLGRAEDARKAWAELLKVNPGFSLNQRERVLPYKHLGDFQKIVEGLARPGVTTPDISFYNCAHGQPTQCPLILNLVPGAM
jgi:hypothetical protein